MLPQLQWLRQPASLLRLLERPVWIDAWLRGEEERASLLWRRLPNDLLLHILKLRAANKRAVVEYIVKYKTKPEKRSQA